MDCVYLPAALETPFDLLDTLQPLQGCFPNIISINEKDDLRKTGWLPMNRGKGSQEERNQSEDKKQSLHFSNHPSTRPPFINTNEINNVTSLRARRARQSHS